MSEDALIEYRGTVGPQLSNHFFMKGKNLFRGGDGGLEEAQKKSNMASGHRGTVGKNRGHTHEEKEGSCTNREGGKVPCQNPYKCQRGKKKRTRCRPDKKSGKKQNHSMDEERHREPLWRGRTSLLFGFKEG